MATVTTSEEPLHPSKAGVPAGKESSEFIQPALADAARIAETKQRLRASLARHHGCSKHPEVVAAIHDLAALNPTPRPARSSLMAGAWRMLSAPDFPGRIRPAEGEENTYKFTLGHISFGLYEPRCLECTLGSIRSPIEPLPRGEEWASDGGLTYPIVISLTLRTEGGDLHATMRNDGVVVPATDERATVVFSRGALSPAPEVVADAARMALWRKTFANVYARADAERSYLARAGRAVFFALVGMVAPTDRADSFSFEMKRPYKGWLDVLYLDEEMRITRGNRGSYVVVEK